MENVTSSWWTKLTFSSINKNEEAVSFCHIWLSFIDSQLSFFKETENLGSDISQKHSIFHVSWRRKNNFLSPAT